LKFALEDSKKQKKSTLLDIKVLPKTMTHDYGSWWRVGIASVSNNENIKSQEKKITDELSKARQY
jgi:3D-(3,5/4)-trihydroxycyclohexane-1,2-dione acylhydrolase (decyclizing)